HLRHDAADVHGLIDEAVQRLRRRAGKELQLGREFVERMAADVEAEGLFLEAELLFFGPFDRRETPRRRRRSRRTRKHSEQRVLAALLLVFAALRGVGRRLELLDERFARLADEVERSRLDQRLQHFLVARAQIDFLAELQERLVPADAAARIEDRFDRALANALHGAEA